MTVKRAHDATPVVAERGIERQELPRAPWSMRELLAADLLRATGRAGLKATASALVFEPGFAAVFAHRVAVALYRHNWPRLAKLVWRMNVLSCGCHVHLDADIGPGLLLPHPIGIVIGSGTTIGAGVTLYQGVTLGRARRAESYPTIGDDAVVYPGAVVVGDVSVGRRAVVGAGAVVIADVDDDTTVAGNPARAIQPRRACDEH